MRAVVFAGITALTASLVVGCCRDKKNAATWAIRASPIPEAREAIAMPAEAPRYLCTGIRLTSPILWERSFAGDCSKSEEIVTSFVKALGSELERRGLALENQLAARGMVECRVAIEDVRVPAAFKIEVRVFKNEVDPSKYTLSLYCDSADYPGLRAGIGFELNEAIRKVEQALPTAAFDAAKASIPSS